MEYRFSGHMIFDTAIGRYTLEGNKIIPHYYPIPIDTSSWAQLRKIGLGSTIQFEIWDYERKKYGSSAPKLMLVKNSKIFLCDSLGNRIKYEVDRNGRKRRYYLKKL